MKGILIKSVGVYLNTLAYIAPNVAARKGFAFFCYPKRIPLKQHHKAFLNTAEKFDFTLNKEVMQGYKWGNGAKKILFLHGWQSNTFRWKNYVKELPQDEYTIYSIDAPGHGLSSGKMLHIPLYSEVIKTFIERTGKIDTVVSHSMGGFAILHALHINSSLPVNKLIIMGAPGEGSDFVNVYQNILNLSEKMVDLTMKHFEEVIGKPIDYFSTARFVKNLSIPGLIIHDKQDKEAPFKYAEKITKIWKNSSLLATEGLNHNLKSDAIVKAVTDFIIENKLEYEGV